MMKQYYLDKIKKCEKKIAFFEEIIKDEKKLIERYKKWVKEEEIDEAVENYKKQLMEENKNGNK